MSTATLKAQVQLRIDALTPATPAIDILQNAVDTVGLDLDLTNITSVLNSATAAITGATPDDDITSLNSASIALGVTSKGVNQSFGMGVDLSYISNKAIGYSGTDYNFTAGIDASTALTQVINASGSGIVRLIEITGITNATANSKVKVTSDGVVVIDDTFTSETTLSIIGFINVNSLCESFAFKESFIVEVQFPGDTDISLRYSVRPLT